MMLVIYGPTATGKTALALKIAKKYKGEIISADSRQVYKGLDIGTGKISPEMEFTKHNKYWLVEGIKVRGFDLVDPSKRFSAADFIELAKSSVAEIIKSKKLPIIVGGTGFYIKTFLDGLETQGIKPNWKLRKRLEKLTSKELFQMLKKNNPKQAKKMNISDKQNPRRLIRAIEVSLSPYQSEEAKPISTNLYMMVGLTAPNDFLYKKANSWLSARLKLGILEEVESLIRSEVNPLWLENLGLEYRWLTRFVLGRIEKSEALEGLRRDIHSFIRRQKTYFRQFPTIELYDISKKGISELLEKRVELWYIKRK